MKSKHALIFVVLLLLCLAGVTKAQEEAVWQTKENFANCKCSGAVVHITLVSEKAYVYIYGIKEDMAESITIIKTANSIVVESPRWLSIVDNNPLHLTGEGITEKVYKDKDNGPNLVQEALPCFLQSSKQPEALTPFINALLGENSKN